jgi:hypothetical protein
VLLVYIRERLENISMQKNDPEAFGVAATTAAAVASVLDD